MFNEGYHAAEGDAEIRPELCAEAIRLATPVAEHPLAGSPKARALLALMQLHASRLPARATAGELSLLEHQDRTRWDRRLVAAGLRNLDASAGVQLPHDTLRAIASDDRRAGELPRGRDDLSSRPSEASGGILRGITDIEANEE